MVVKVIDGYFNTYLYKYMLDPAYQKANSISINLKAAMWRSYADFDYSNSKKDTSARLYWLDEKQE